VPGTFNQKESWFLFVEFLFVEVVVVTVLLVGEILCPRDSVTY